MPRRPLISTNVFPYHVTTRSNNREWFYIPIDEVWRILLSKAATNSELFGTVFHSIVLMANHLHLLLSTPNSNMGDVTRHLFTEVSKAIQKRAGRINHVFGARYKWSLLTNPSAVAYVYKYVLRNPVRASLVNAVEDYCFSTISSHQRFPVIADGIGPMWKSVPQEFRDRLNWLNKPVQKDLEIWISRGLRRESFQLSNGNDARKELQMLHDQYAVRLEENA